jgi:hypothetical protein
VSQTYHTHPISLDYLHIKAQGRFAGITRRRDSRNAARYKRTKSIPGIYFASLLGNVECIACLGVVKSFYIHHYVTAKLFQRQFSHLKQLFNLLAQDVCSIYKGYFKDTELPPKIKNEVARARNPLLNPTGTYFLRS